MDLVLRPLVTGERQLGTPFAVAFMLAKAIAPGALESVVACGHRLALEKERHAPESTRAA